MAGISQLHFDQSLTNVSVAFKNADMIAERVFPPVPVGKQSNKYFVYSKDRLRVTDDRRRPGAEANEANWDYSSDTYYADGHARKAPVPDEWRENADSPLDLDVDAVETLTDQIQLNKEVALVAALAAGMTPVSQAAQYWDDNSVDPIKIIDGYKETVAKAIGLKPQVMAISRPVFRAIRNNANVVGRVTGAGKLADALITAEQLRQVLELDELLIGEAIKVTSNEGQTTITTDYVWGKYALLFYRPPSPGLRTVSLGYTFKWNTGVMGRLVKRYRAEGRSADIIEAQEYYDQKVVASGAGVLCSACIA